MLVRNAFTAARTIAPSRHGGVGSIEKFRVFQGDDFESGWRVVAYDVLPPGTVIGVHDLGNAEEIYFVLEGHGIMTIDGEEREVGPGDMALAKQGSMHGICNPTDRPLSIIVIEVEVRPALARVP